MTILASAVLFYLVLMIPISFIASKHVKNSTDYVLAGRNLPFYMATATVFATWLGSDSIIGAGSQMAQGGFLNVIADPFGAGLCLILIGIFFVPKLYKLNHLTIGDYYKERYNQTIATLISLAIVLTYFGWVAAQFVALGLIMQFVFGMTFLWGIIISAAVVVIYTYIGGMWSVVLHDLIQTTLIIIGLIAILVAILWQMGGINEIIANTPPEYFKFLPETTTKDWLTYLAAWITIGLGSIPQQDVYQRAMSAKNVTVSKWSSITGGVLYLTVVMIPLILGLAARILHPELLTPGADPQLLIPTLVQLHTNIFVQVLFYGALLSAIMSTASAAILAPATLVAENIVKPMFPKITDKALMNLIKICILVISTGSILIGIKQGNIYELVSSSYSITLVAAFVPLVAGLYWKKAGNISAMLSILLGTFSWQYVEHFTDESFIVPSTIVGLGMAVIGLLVGIIFDHIMRTRKHEGPIETIEASFR